jgi:hypothetical protein
MKNIFILSALLLTGCIGRAQRFFYIENSHLTAKLLTDELQHAFQYVTASPIASDYILKSEVDFQAETHSLTLQIIMQDSVSFQTLYQANEVYDVRKSNSDPRIFLSMAIRTFLEKNIHQIISTAKDDHFNSELKSLDVKKDKT